MEATKGEKRRNTYRAVNVNGITFVGTPDALDLVTEETDVRRVPSDQEYFRGAWIILDPTQQLPDESMILHTAKDTLAAAVDLLHRKLDVPGSCYSVSVEISSRYALELLK